MFRITTAITLLLLLVSCGGVKYIHNVVIIGGGLMGSSAGWELAKSCEKALLIEQQDKTYTFGSSLGEARISRSLGEKGDIFSFLQQQSVAQTAALIDYLNETENAQINLQKLSHFETSSIRASKSVSGYTKPTLVFKLDIS